MPWKEGLGGIKKEKKEKDSKILAFSVLCFLAYCHMNSFTTSSKPRWPESSETVNSNKSFLLLYCLPDILVYWQKRAFENKGPDLTETEALGEDFLGFPISLLTLQSGVHLYVHLMIKDNLSIEKAAMDHLWGQSSPDIGLLAPHFGLSSPSQCGKNQFLWWKPPVWQPERNMTPIMLQVLVFFYLQFVILSCIRLLWQKLGTELFQVCVYMFLCVPVEIRTWSCCLFLSSSLCYF